MSDILENAAEIGVGVGSGYTLAKALEVNENVSDAKTAGIILGAAVLSSIVDSFVINPLLGASSSDETSTVSRTLNLAARCAAAAHGLKRNEDDPNAWLYGVAWFLAGAPGIGVAIEQGFREKA